MGQIEEAIKKINAEIQKQPNNEYLALIGEHIIDCITTEDTAEEVLKTEKTLAGALREIEANAAKRKSGKVAVVEDAVVYGWAREYFGLTTNPAKKRSETAKPQTAAKVPAAPKKEKEVNLDFDSFFA